MPRSSRKKVRRVLIFAHTLDDSDARIIKENFGLSKLLETLLNKLYVGPDLKLVNVSLVSKDFFAKHNSMWLGHYKGDINVGIEFDQAKYNSTHGFEQKQYVWQLACAALLHAAQHFKLEALAIAVQTAQAEGLTLDLNTDRLLLQKIQMIGELKVVGELWVSFQPDMIVSTLIVIVGGHMILRKQIDRGHATSEFFLEMYKEISIDPKKIVIRLSRQATPSTTKIPIDYGIVN